MEQDRITRHEGIERRSAGRRPWTKPALTKLKDPSDAQAGIIIGPEVLVLLQS